jgi:hypothetical protein
MLYNKRKGEIGFHKKLIKKKNKKMSKKTLISIIVIVVVIVVVVVVVVAGNHGAPAQQTAQNNNGQAQQSEQNDQQPSAAPLPVAAYTSAKDGFTVNFPGTPEVATKTIKSPSAGSISETEYTYVSSTNGKGALYMIIVFHYPATYQFSSSYLASAMQMFNVLINAKYPGTKVVNQPQSQFLGNAAISGLVTVPFMGTPTPGNVLITVKNHNTYVVSAYGLSESDYNTFLNSFTFTP